MKVVRTVAMIVMGLATAGCASMDVASRNAPFEAPQATVASAAVKAAVKVESYQVRVPRTLRVSEANLYYPSGDIVWRGEPLGDRHTQVQKIFEGSLGASIPQTETGVPVLLDIEVTRFHALTEKARYTVGGVHSIEFNVNFLDPVSRQPIAPQRHIKADLKGFGGARAIAAERNGVTQKLRISEHLKAVFRNELGGETKQPVVTQAQPIKVQHVSRNTTALTRGDKTNGLF